MNLMPPMPASCRYPAAGLGMLWSAAGLVSLQRGGGGQ